MITKKKALSLFNGRTFLLQLKAWVGNYISQILETLQMIILCVRNAKIQPMIISLLAEFM